MCVLLLAVLETVGIPAAHAHSYAPYEWRQYESHAESVAIGEVTGDDLLDLVVATGSLGAADDFKLLIYAGSSDGLLAVSPIEVLYGETYSGTGLILADLDRDGTDEIVVSHRDELTIARWTSTGFTTTTVLNEGPNTWLFGYRPLAVLDINRDGYSDIASLPWWNPIRFYMNDGAGNLGVNATLPAINEGFNDMESADLDRDGNLDLVVLNGQGGAFPPATLDVSIYYHDGVSGFRAPINFDFGDTARGKSGLALGDLNSDGRIDIALSGSGNVPVDQFIMYQQSDGSFGPMVTIPTADLPRAMLSADLDRNGMMDLAVVHAGSGIGVYLQQQSGLDTERLTQLLAPQQHNSMGIAAGDFLGLDGCPDLAIASEAGLFALRGQDCVGTDLIAEAMATLAEVEIVVQNVSGDVAVAPVVIVRFDFTRRSGAVSPPSNCVATSGSFGKEFECVLPQLLPHSNGRLVFALSGARARGFNVSGRVSTSSQELNTSNNSFRVSAPAPAAVLRQSTGVRDQRRSASRVGV
jgi:hypothetical protein